MSMFTSRKKPPRVTKTPETVIEVFDYVENHPDAAEDKQFKVNLFVEWLSRALSLPYDAQSATLQDLNLIYDRLLVDDVWNYERLVSNWMLNHPNMNAELAELLIKKYCRQDTYSTVLWGSSAWVNHGDFTVFFKADKDARHAVSQNPVLSAENVERFISMESQVDLHGNVLSNPNVTPDLMFHLLDGILREPASGRGYQVNQWDVFESAVMNPNLTGENMQQLLEQIVDRWKNVPLDAPYNDDILFQHSNVLYMLMFHENTSRSTLLEAYRYVEQKRNRPGVTASKFYRGDSIMSRRLMKKIASMPEYEGWPEEWVDAEFE